ncbi:glycosyltransferase family A protein, partial [Vibrio cholerae]
KRKNNKRLIDRKKNALDNNFKCDKGLVSVIIPIYDRTWELKEAIQSILDQSYEKTELILICDGSPQETINIVDEYQSNDKVKIFKYPTSSGNAVRGRNKGIKEANGEFIAFLDSDDIADVNRLKNSVSFLNDNKNYAGVYGAW